MTVEFRYRHPRAVKARFANHFRSSASKDLIKLLIAIFSIFGITAWVLVGPEFAWVMSVPVVLYMFYIWLVKDIFNLPATIQSSSDDFINLNDALAPDFLSQLKDPRTFQGILDAASKSQSAIFMANRFELTLSMFDEPPQDDTIAEKIWWEAYSIAKRTGQDKITGGMVLMGLLSQVPSRSQVLAQLHIEYEDMLNGVYWQDHIEEMIDKFGSKSFLGGVARDWTAGYTPVLSQIGANISSQIQVGGGIAKRDLESHHQTVDQIVGTLANSSNSNVALIGELGVGKTTTVYSFADRLLSDKTLPDSVKFHQVYILDAATILANKDMLGSLENLFIEIVGEVQKAKNIILFLDNAELFFKEEVGAVDLKNVLQPILNQGDVRLIMAMTPNEWQQITKNNAPLASTLNRIVIKEQDQAESIKVLEDQVLSLEPKHGVTYTYQSIVEAYRLADKYVQEGAFPGKAISLLDSAAQFHVAGFVYETSIQQSIESTMGVKVQKADGQEKTELLNLEDTIHKRMINQERAVKVVSDALRRARSGVNNPEKPIGTFLFLGPTGVGKTELSKSVSAAYFGGDGNIVRIDMNEFNSSDAGDRIIDPNDSGGNGLISQIRKQPFSVVLFDEIEKADPKVLDLFLQVLDEGIMRDKANKEVSFRDAIIIATSNAAAADIQKLIAGGHNLEDIEEQFVSQLISSGHFKPEFLNRFDEIVLFRPLNKEELLQVVDLIMNSVNENLSRQKVSVQLTDDAKVWLVDHGYDARLGARPLRRMVQKTVENIVAKKLLDSSFNAGETLTLNAQDLESEK